MRILIVTSGYTETDLLGLIVLHLETLFSFKKPAVYTTLLLAKHCSFKILFLDVALFRKALGCTIHLTITIQVVWN